MTNTTIKTLSFDARAVNPNNLFAGFTLPFRRDCNGFIKTISEQNSGWIYVTNIEDFYQDRNRYNMDAEHARFRGMQFDVQENKGFLFTSYAYIKNSVRAGGYTDYPLK